MTTMQRAGDSGRPTIVISGSLAFDYIMTYPGSFQDHIIPDKTHVLSLSFLFDSLRRYRGGVAGNIAYNFALLGERPALVGAGGSDFGDYRETFDLLGIDTSRVIDVPAELTGSAFMSADLAGNQIAGFYPGASNAAAELSVLDLGRGAVFGMVGATTREAMRRHAREFAECGCRLIYDPSQQVVSLDAEELREGIYRAWGVIGSDYEMAVIEQKTGLSVSDLVARVPFVGVTFAEHGSDLHLEGQHAKIPAVTAEPLIEPTGGGDAYRAGLFKGLALGLPLEIAGRMGSVAATYAVERHGSQEHAYTPAEFVDRFEVAFPEYAGAVSVEWLRCPVDRDLAEVRLSGHAIRGD
ncbi:MAG TPA: carbohydrate kinase family protein [Thermomicrobiales bacterium]|jgi:adenosine kinase|nr:carbohydrate kinase family protein [Thermomicrobiales bacterium]